MTNFIPQTAYNKDQTTSPDAEVIQDYPNTPHIAKSTSSFTISRKPQQQNLQKSSNEDSSMQQDITRDDSLGGM